MSIGTPPPRAQWFKLAEAASVGIEMAVAVAIGHFGGRYLQDHVTHWAPWTYRIGLIVGFGAAVMAVVRTAVHFKRHLDAEEAAEAARKAAGAQAERPPGDDA
ncbi:MAG TPA: AtpZ/AtpI family protein [Nannocystaceae bacterium]|nr:AtpZ/AtpI family protein [Nannocystaceae bacterium]